DRQTFVAGNARLVIGRLKATFEITRNSDVLSYGVLYLGEHHINCGVRHYQGLESYEAMSREMQEAFDRADFAQVIRVMDQRFGESNYTLAHLFKDEQRKVLNQIFANAREDLHDTIKHITERYTPLQRFL